MREEAISSFKAEGKIYTNEDVVKAANEIFWNRYNLPFLEEAFQRGDDIRLLSDPSTLFGSTGFYQREIEVITIGWKKTDGTKVEYFLKKYNYRFNSLTKVYEKIR